MVTLAAPSAGRLVRHVAALGEPTTRGDALYSKLRDGRIVERFGQDVTPLYLFGAGHVGRALVLALAPLPFAVTWFDPRPGAFPPHIPAMNRAGDNPAEVVRAHDGIRRHYDRIATRFLDLPPRLQGATLPLCRLIGSATKRARFVSTLAKLGVAKPDIDRLICPIGLSDIKDKAPAAIAASIIAQLLIVRERGVVPLAGNDSAPAQRTSSKHHA